MSQNMNPMDKFLNQYQTFCQHEAVKDLSEQGKISLFSGFCQAMIAKQNAGAPDQTKKSSSRLPGCTHKQKGMIMRLVKGGHLEEPTWEALTVKSASRLIDKGLAAERKAEAEAQEEETANEPQGEFGGSYSLC